METDSLDFLKHFLRVAIKVSGEHPDMPVILTKDVAQNILNRLEQIEEPENG